ncbi:MAG: hypothetical protein AB8F78_15065 [Saprospiraceae bacterium]
MNFKSILFAALVAGASTAVAQNTATSEQYGDGNSSDISQTTANTAVVLQGTSTNASTDNVAEVTQYGTNSGNGAGVFITQKNDVYATPVHNNIAFVEQGVNDNASADNTATVNSNGHRNRSITAQDGTGNVASITQVGRYNTADGGSWQVGSAPTLYGIKQVGNNNDYSISQNGRDNRARSTAEGNDNMLTVSQGPVSTGNISSFGENSVRDFTDGDGNSATISQVGRGNHSYRDVDGNDNQLAQVTQNGNYNKSLIAITGNSNDMAFNQQGNDNVISLDGMASGNANSRLHDAVLSGDDNDLSVNQDGEDMLALDVVGNLNMVTVDQNAGANSGTVIINGNSNMSTITQN